MEVGCGDEEDLRISGDIQMVEMCDSEYLNLSMVIESKCRYALYA